MEKYQKKSKRLKILFDLVDVYPCFLIFSIWLILENGNDRGKKKLRYLIFFAFIFFHSTPDCIAYGPLFPKYLISFNRSIGATIHRGDGA